MNSIHATCVELEGVGLLLRGPPGSGKSDLALRLIEAGGRLVADDRVVVERLGERLIASPPPTLAGQIEIRGIGLRRLVFCESVEVGLVIDLVAPEEVERLPEALTATLAGIDLPQLRLAPFEASAVAKVRLAARTLALKSAEGAKQALGRG